MKFEDFWKEVWQEMSLPSEAEKWLPESFTDETKKKSIKMNAEVVAKTIEAAVDKVNHGAIDSLDKQVNAAMNG